MNTSSPPTLLQLLEKTPRPNPKEWKILNNTSSIVSCPEGSFEYPYAWDLLHQMVLSDDLYLIRLIDTCYPHIQAHSKVQTILKVHCGYDDEKSHITCLYSSDPEICSQVEKLLSHFTQTTSSLENLQTDLVETLGFLPLNLFQCHNNLDLFVQNLLNATNEGNRIFLCSRIDN